ncbi:MAG TPA: formate--tetrahydrofolate ligase, partial [Bacteroidia bacterium]
MSNSVPSDLEIAQSAKIGHINEIARKLHIPTEELEHYGRYKAKIPLTFLNEDKIKKGKLILVTAITPTPAG